MKIKCLILLLFISSLCYANNVFRYKVEGKLTRQLNGKYAYLQVFANTLQKAQFLQAKIVNGHFVFTGTAKCETGAYCSARLFITDKAGVTSKDITTLMKNVNYDSRKIVLEENAFIEIGASVKESSVKGGQLNDINNQFEKCNLEFYKKQKDLTDKRDEQIKQNKGDKVKIEQLNAECGQQLLFSQDQKTKNITELVKLYPYSKQAMESFMMIAVLNEHVSAKYQPLLESTWNDLPLDAKTTKEAKQIMALINKTGMLLKLKEGVMIPNYTFLYGKGDSVSVNNYRGKYLFIDFWTSWCGPCRAEHFYMKKSYERFKSKNFSIVQVSLDENEEKWQKAIREEELPWINFRCTKGWDKEVEKTFDIKGIPANYLVAPDGKIIARGLRGEALEKKLSEILGQE